MKHKPLTEVIWQVRQNVQFAFFIQEANIIPHLLDCKPRLIKLFFHHFVRLTIKGGLQSRAAYIFFFSLSKCLDDAESFFGYVLLTKPSFRIIFLLFSIMCTSVTGGIMMNRGSYSSESSLSLPGLLIKPEACYKRKYLRAEAQVTCDEVRLAIE